MACSRYVNRFDGDIPVGSKNTDLKLDIMWCDTHVTSIMKSIMIKNLGALEAIYSEVIVTCTS